MKLRFFGDSWCWCWALPLPLADTILSKRSHDFSVSLPLLSWYLTALDIESEILGNPGNPMTHVRDVVINATNNEGVDYNILFVSSPYRRQSVETLPVDDYENFIAQWNDALIYSLRDISRWAEEHNQVFFIVGGQTTITQELFDKVEAGKNIHLLSECLVSDFTGRTEPFGMFKLADFTKSVNSRFDPKLVDHIYDDINQYASSIEKSIVTWPDSAHLNPTGQFMLINLILRKIEELEGEKE
jgi:hypothetical protein